MVGPLRRAFFHFHNWPMVFVNLSSHSRSASSAISSNALINFAAFEFGRPDGRSFRNPPATEFSSAPFSHTPDAPPCCCGPRPPAQTVPGSRTISPAPPTHTGNCATSLPLSQAAGSVSQTPSPGHSPAPVTDTGTAAYWKTHIATHPYFNPECECLVVFILNTRRRIKGHYLVSIGTMDTILCHPREIFRLAIMASAAAIIIAHSHPSGDPTPSEADIKITRDLIRAGQLLKIEVLDHIVIGLC